MDRELPDVWLGPRSWHVMLRRRDRFDYLKRSHHTNRDLADGESVKYYGPERRTGESLVCAVEVPRKAGRGRDRALKIARDVRHDHEGVSDAG